MEDENVEVVPMSDEDFEDEMENRNEFEQPTFTSEWWVEYKPTNLLPTRYEREKANFKNEHDKNGDGYLGKDYQNDTISNHSGFKAIFA